MSIVCLPCTFVRTGTYFTHQIHKLSVNWKFTDAGKICSMQSRKRKQHENTAIINENNYDCIFSSRINNCLFNLKRYIWPFTYQNDFNILLRVYKYETWWEHFALCCSGKIESILPCTLHMHPNQKYTWKATNNRTHKHAVIVKNHLHGSRYMLTYRSNNRITNNSKWNFMIVWWKNSQKR